MLTSWTRFVCERFAGRPRKTTQPGGRSATRNRRCQPSLAELERRLVPSSANVLTNHNDGSNDGQNLNETVLTPTTVNGADFGKLFSVSLDGAEQGQPLFVSGLNITTGPMQGVQDVALVATSKASLYAINADNGTVLWKTSLLNKFHGATDTVTPASAKGNAVEDTPAIDLTTNAIYVEAEEIENGAGTGNANHFIHMLSALNLADGSNYANPTLIAEGTQSSGSGYVSGPNVNGKQFNSFQMTSRCLTLNSVNGVIYMAYGNPGDTPPYNGYIVGYTAAKDGSGNLDLKAVFNVTPNGSEAGIWQGGGAIAVDAAGNLYVETGNGTFDTSLITAPYSGRLSTDVASLQVPSGGDYGDSVLKLAPDGDATQQSDNPNGFGLHVADYFTPNNEQSLSNGDVDLGSSSPVLLPDSVGSAAHQQLLFINDKSGVIYLIDRNNMGGYVGPANGQGTGLNTNVVQQLDGATHGAWATGAFFAAGGSTSGTIYYATRAEGESVGDVAKAFAISGAHINPTPTSTSASSYGTYSYPGSTPEVSANGGSNGILWTLDKSPSSGTAGSRLIAYDASNLNTVLFRSDQIAGNALTGSVQTFSTLTVANGHVYVGTSNALNVFGLPPLTATVTADASNVASGSAAGFTLTIANTATGTTATGLTLTDPLPALGLGHTWSINGGANASSFTVTGAAGSQQLALASGVNSLAGGSSLVVHITGTTTSAETVLTDAATVHSSGVTATGSAKVSVNPLSGISAVGAAAGGGPEVKVYNADGTVRFDFFAYAPSWTGGVRVAVGDVTGDGVPDIITAPGTGGGPHVEVFDGQSGQLIRSFFAYDPSFAGGVFVAAADVNGDGNADIVTGAGAGGGPNVKVFDGRTNNVLMSFFAYSSTFTGGVTVAAGDVNGDGKADVITGAGAGGGPNVKVFDGATSTLLKSFFAYGSTFTGGVYVSAGDVNGDGKADIITGAGAGGGPNVKVFDGASLNVLDSFFAYGSTFAGGVSVGAADINGDGIADIITGPGPTGAPELKVFNGTNLNLLRDIGAFNPAFLGGIFVG